MKCVLSHTTFTGYEFIKRFTHPSCFDNVHYLHHRKGQLCDNAQLNLSTICLYPLNLIHGISNHIGWVTIVVIHIIGLSPIPLDVSWTNFLDSHLVKGSARFFSDLTNSKAITPLFISCRTMLCLNCICLCFPLYNLFFARPIAA